jgi:transposase
LYQNGKSKSDITKEYDIHISVIGRWISQYDNSGSFKEKENISELELENIQLKKRNKELEMENDILKQAALILVRK